MLAEMQKMPKDGLWENLLYAFLPLLHNFNKTAHKNIRKLAKECVILMVKVELFCAICKNRKRKSHLLICRRSAVKTPEFIIAR